MEKTTFEELRAVRAVRNPPVSRKRGGAFGEKESEKGCMILRRKCRPAKHLNNTLKGKRKAKRFPKVRERKEEELKEEGGTRLKRRIYTAGALRPNPRGKGAGHSN